MKKINIILSFCILLTSCYNDYIKDYEHDGIYFPNQTNVRTFVVGEGMKIEVGVVLGGVMENKKERMVQYVLDDDLITDDVLQSMKNGLDYVKESVEDIDKLLLMPNNYYTISDPSKIIIDKGQHSGTVVIKADSVNFLNDKATINAKYVLPFCITDADADSIIENKRYAVIGLKYENLLFGNYWHGGVTVVKDDAGNVVKEVKYYTSIPAPESKVWTLKTVSPFILETNGLSDNADTGSLRIELKQNGEIVVGKSSSSDIVIIPDGESLYNQAKLLQDRKIFLSYKFKNPDGTTSYAKDTLTFRNRIRDGVNEWQDENPLHYK